MNLKTKIILGAFALLIGTITTQYFVYKSTVSDLEQKNIDLEEEKKQAVREERDNATARIDTLTMESTRKFDSILSLPPTIKWKVYEKPVYPNRTLGDALDIHANYKADQRARAEN